MMGIAQYSLETSIIKNTNAILAFDKDEGDLPPESPCIPVSYTHLLQCVYNKQKYIHKVYVIC